MHCVAVGRGVGGGAHEFEELCGAYDRVREAGAFDELFLREFGPHVGAVGYSLGADDGKRNVVPDACMYFCSQQVSAGGLEELQRRGVVEGRRVGQVDDDLCTD